MNNQLDTTQGLTAVRLYGSSDLALPCFVPFMP